MRRITVRRSRLQALATTEMPDESEGELAECLRQVLQEHGLHCAVVIDATGGIVARVGNFSTLSGPWLASGLLGPYGSALATFEHVASKHTLKPVCGAQGDDFAFLDLVKTRVIVVFGRGRGDALALYHLSKQVGQTIATVFSQAPTTR